MVAKGILASVTIFLLLTIPAAAQPPANAPTAIEPLRSGAAGLGAVPVSIVNVILDQRQALGLSASQIENLERLDLDVIRDAIRRQADLMIAQVDLGALLDLDPTESIDVAKAEAKMREIERIRTDLQIALVRAAEAAKAQLTSDQRAKLVALIDDDPSVPGDARAPADAPSEARGTGHAPPGGGVARPHPPAPHIPPGPRPDHRRFDRRPHAHVFGWPPLWWDLFWAYPSPPATVPGPQTYEGQNYWYYCPSLRAYYPYVTSCPEPWVLVPVGVQ